MTAFDKAFRDTKSLPYNEVVEIDFDDNSTRTAKLLEQMEIGLRLKLIQEQ